MPSQGMTLSPEPWIIMMSPPLLVAFYRSSTHFSQKPREKKMLFSSPKRLNDIPDDAHLLKEEV